MIVQTYIRLLPILAMAGGGYLLSRIYTLSSDTLVKVIMDFMMPMLIFHALYTSEINGLEILSLAGVTTFVVAVLLGAALLYVRITGVQLAGFVPPVIFMNSGFLGIPLMMLWSGSAAMNMMVIYDQIQSFYIFSLGIILITGSFGLFSLKRMFSSPILWAIIGGFGFRFLHIPIPGSVLSVLDFGGRAAPPLAAFTLGISLGETRFKISRHLVAALILRIPLGFLAGMAGAALFGLEGTARMVVIVASSLPSAVFASVLPLRYGIRAELAGTVVLVSTLLGVVTMPLSFILAS
jgi:predicted permease